MGEEGDSQRPAEEGIVRQRFLRNRLTNRAFLVSTTGLAMPSGKLVSTCCIGILYVNAGWPQG